MRALLSCLILSVIFAAEMAAYAEPAQGAGGPYSVSKTLPIGGDGRWDYAIVDPAAKLLYVTRQSHVQVVSTDTGKVVADIKDTQGVHGVALAPELNRGFSSNGQAGSVTVFDLKTHKELGKVPAGQNPDAIIYDPASKKVLAFNGRSHDVTAFDAAAEPGAGTHPTRIPLDGKPEFAVADGEGRVFVNLEDKSSIVVIDTKAMKVADVWKIEGGEEPSGLALDAAHHRLFAGCGNDVMAVVDTESGKTLGTVPIGKGVDACGFDPGTGEAFASCGDGTLTVIKETSPGKFGVEQTVRTRQGARTMALDPSTHSVYLPTAEFPPAGGQGRPAPRPGSFMIVVVSRGQQ